MTGEIGILNVGAGDTKLTFDPTKPAEMKRACEIVTDMLKRGYALLIEVGKDADGEPLYRRAKAFDAKTAEYIIAGDPAVEKVIDAKEPPKKEEQPAPASRGRRAAKDVRVPAAKSKAVAVARTAGG